MKNNRINTIVNKAVLASFKNGRLLESIVVKNIKIFKSLPVAESINALHSYLTGIKRKLREHTLIVETAYPLPVSQLRKIKENLSKKYLIIKLEEKINPSLLGGVKIQVGDNVYDNSITTKVEQIKEFIKEK